MTPTTATRTLPALPLASAPGARVRNHLRDVFAVALLGDLVMLALAFGLASWLRFETSLADYGIAGDAANIGWLDYAGHIVFGVLLYVVLLARHGLYTPARIPPLRDVLRITAKTSVVWLLVYVALGALLRVDATVSRGYVLLGAGAAFLAVGGWRRLLHRFVGRAVLAGHMRQRILLVGWSEHAAAFVNAISSDREHPCEIVGCIPSPQGRYDRTPPARMRRLGDYASLPDLFRIHSVDTVVVAGMGGDGGEMIGLANLCEKELVDFKIIPDCFEILVSGLHLEAVRGVPVLGLSRLPLDQPLHLLAKEALDIVGGLVGLLLSLPIIAVFGFLVHRESPGPIFYTQTRLGRNGRHFKIIKIRSMRLDAEAPGKVGWSTKNDPRRLRVGAFMRRWNIDELPQFWNVLRGDMSLVGPRPERPELIVDFKEAIPHYNARHGIKPGITGWAQVNGFRGDTDLNERIRCDLFYIERWSLLLDIRILFMTLFSRKNAC